MSRAGVLLLLAGNVFWGAAPVLPEAFWRLPAEVRTKATVVVSGTYTAGRGPCEWLPNGSHRWPLLEGFTLTTVYRGQASAGYIGIENPGRLGTWGDKLTLVKGREYLLLLRPSQESRKMLRKSERGQRDVLPQDELLEVVEP
jgi:hypothetical protein